MQLICDYNMARVLALYNCCWAAMNKIFIYARPCINKMTWAFFFYLASEFPSRYAAVQFSFSLKYGRNQRRTAQFFYRHWPFRSWSNKQKIKSKKTRKLHVSQICRKTSCSKFWPKDIRWEQPTWVFCCSHNCSSKLLFGGCPGENYKFPAVCLLQLYLHGSVNIILNKENLW